MSRSIFPNGGVDTFPELYDLPLNMMQSATRLTALKMQERLSNDEQNELATLSAELADFLITPELFNTFADSLTGTQQFFRDNVQGFLEDKQVIWENYVKQLTLLGAWVTGKNYKMHNFVYDEKGDLFIALKDHTSNSTNKTTNNSFWQRLSQKGDVGAIGLNAFYKGDWNSDTTYNLGDAVSYKRTGWEKPLVYIAKSTHSNQNPQNADSYWMLYSEVVSGTTRPLGAQSGLHFVKEV